jgi:hypothetical protein
MLFLGPTQLSIAQYVGLGEEAAAPSRAESPDMFDDDDTQPFETPPPLNAKQQEALAAIKSNPGSNFMIQGDAGTGKSFFAKNLSTGYKTTALTYHQFMGIDQFDTSAGKRLKAVVKDPSILRDLKRIVFEEIGMAVSDNVCLLDEVLRKAYNNHPAPFAGIQIITIGDYLQMPPVGNDSLETTPLWHALNLVTIEFTEQMRLSTELDDDGFRDAVKELRTLFMNDTPPSKSLCRVVDMLSVDTAVRTRPRKMFIGLGLTHAVISVHNFEAVVDEAKRHPDTVPYALVTKILKAKKKDGGLKRISTPRLKQRAQKGSAAETEKTDNQEILVGAVPLYVGCPVVVAVNIRAPRADGEAHGATIAHNGRRGRFAGWSNDLPPNPPLVVNNTHFQQVTVKELADLGISPLVEFDDGEIVPLPVGGKGITLKFPIKAGQFVTASSVQGQTISDRLHADFKGESVFDPQIVYTVFSRVLEHAQLSVENLNSDILIAWWHRIRFPK